MKKIRNIIKTLVLERLYNGVKNYINRALIRTIYPAVYKKYSKAPLDEKSVLLIEPEYKQLSNNYFVLYERLKTDYDLKISIHLLCKNSVSRAEYIRRCIRLVREAATAKYIFLDNAFNEFGRIRFREGTVITNIWHACGAFKKFGFATADKIFGTNRKTLEKYPNYSCFDYFTVSSPEVIDIYAESTGLDKSCIVPWGVSRTDQLFDESFRKAAKEKLTETMPASVGKKVILYAPTFRGRIREATTATAFSVEEFYKTFSDAYVLITKHHPYVKERPAIPEEYQDFAADLTDRMDIQELLCVTDICITDYSSLIFEYSLFEKPMIFFAYDLDEYFDWRGFYYSYHDMTPGPVCKTNQEMIDYIRDIDNRFDKQTVIDFRNKFMSSCDGHATERILKNIFSNTDAIS